jgi:hypothetical protein
MKFANKIFELNSNASFRELGEEGIILMTDSGQLYSTNETGTAFMNYLGNDMSFREIVEKLSNEFDVTIDLLTQDLTELAEHLCAESVLRISDHEKVS